MMALITNQICDLEDALDFTSFELFFPDTGRKSHAVSWIFLILEAPSMGRTYSTTITVCRGDKIPLLTMPCLTTLFTPKRKELLVNFPRSKIME